jgi:flagellin-specific chaperone FliS
MFASGATNEQKKEYIKVLFDDAFETYSQARELITKEEWEEIKVNILANKKDILTEQDIEILSKAIELELR